MANERTVIVGGGLAGLAAAVALAPHGLRITLIESKLRFGGRASSFTDPTTGETIDLCQHVAMGCCTNFAHFCATLGIRQFLVPQPNLYFMTPDRQVSRFAADRLPAPLHLARSFARLHSLSLGEKIRVAYGLLQLRRHRGDDDPPFADWLMRHRQTTRTIDRFWGLVLTSALNETCDRIGIRYARKVFVDGFMTHPRGFEVELPSVPLGRLYGDELRTWLVDHKVEVALGTPVKRIRIEGRKTQGVETWNGEMIDADFVITAAPFERLLDLLPEETVANEPYFGRLRELQHSPITSVHCWFDRAATELPHVVLIDCLGQWVFNRGQTPAGDYYLQVVVSAARMFREADREEVERRVVEELRHFLVKKHLARRSGLRVPRLCAGNLDGRRCVGWLVA